MPEPGRGRVAPFAVVTVLCVLAAVGYAIHAARRTSMSVGGTNVALIDNPQETASVAAGDHLIFRSTAVAQAHGRLALARIADTAGARYLTDLECERVDMNGGTGVCLTADRGFVATYGAVIFDTTFKPRGKLTLTGIPSRTRVSPDGKLAAITTFVSGHSYAGGSFSTRTVIVDTTTGKEITELEQFAVSKDGQTIKSPDFNFWGVTFAPDSNRFYATLGTGGHLYLIEGVARSQKARVLREGVECPSISPDGTRLAFKKRTYPNGRMIWRLAVLDLQSMQEQVVPDELRSIDDQVEWLDQNSILYGAEDAERGLGGTSVWAVGVRGGAPQKLLPGAYSPSVVRNQ